MKSKSKFLILLLAACLLNSTGCKQEPLESYVTEAPELETKAAKTSGTTSPAAQSETTTSVSESTTSETTIESTAIIPETDKPADTTSEETVSSGSFTYDKYFKFMLSRTEKDKNAVFSPESINAAFNIYSELLNDEDKARIKDFTGNKPYLQYESSDVFKIINRLWYNQNKEIHIENSTALKDSNIGYALDMNDSAKATEEKDNYVAENTNGFITSTPTLFTSDTVFDAMNIVYFKDAWEDGDKTVDVFETDFHNSDGTITPVLMMRDYDSSVFASDTAYSYMMYYQNGFTINILLPKEGYSVEDINIDDFINKNIEWVSGDCRFSMPEFESECTYMVGMGAFGLQNSAIREDIYANPLDPAQISQVAKIRVDHEGTEAAAVSEILMNDAAAFAPETPFDFICDKPFAYYITDTLNDDIAFIGVVNKL